MALDSLTTVFCGSAFGMALTAAGVHRPDVIISQLTLTNFHMLESFLTAAAGSVALVTILQRLRFINASPRTYSSIGFLGSLDGNIIGGLMQGVGMAFSGSCPGTVFAQVGAGIKSGLYTLAGLILGGILWTGFLRSYIRKRTAKKELYTGPTSIDKRLGLGQLEAVVVIEVIFALIIAIASSKSTEKSQGLVHPIVGGGLIAGAQLLSVMLRKTLLGTSTAFEEVGDWFWSVVKGGNAMVSQPSYRNILFVSGVTLGARFVLVQSSAAVRVDTISLDSLRAVTGGVLLAVGSRIAGGCTSGHGISGISLLSVSSYVTVASMFAGAIGTALTMYSK